MGTGEDGDPETSRTVVETGKILTGGGRTDGSGHVTVHTRCLVVVMKDPQPSNGRVDNLS